MPNPKLLIIHSANELFGADLVLLRAADALRADGWELTVLLPDDLPYEGALGRELAKRGCTVICRSLGILRRQYLKPSRVLQYFWQLMRAVMHVRRLVQREKYAAVYSATSAVLCGALAAHGLVPHVWHLHEILERPRIMVRVLAALLARRAEAVIAVSQPVYDHWVKLDRRLARNLHVIHNGIDLAYYAPQAHQSTEREAMGVRPDEILVGCLGRIGSWKGQEFLIAALAEIPAEAKIKCLLGGGTVPGQEYKMAALRELVNRHGLQERVLIRDFQKDIRPWLQAMDIFVLPSIKPDPFPTVVLEAMAFRLPVIATNHGGPMEMVIPGKTGFLVAPQATAEMAGKIQQLAADSGLRRALGEAGRQRLETTYPLAEFNRKIIGVFNRWRP